MMDWLEHLDGECYVVEPSRLSLHTLFRLVSHMSRMISLFVFDAFFGS